MIEKSTDGGWNEIRFSIPGEMGILSRSDSLPGSKKLSMIYPQQLRGTTGGAVAMVNIPLVIRLRSKTL